MGVWQSGEQGNSGLGLLLGRRYRVLNEGSLGEGQQSELIAVPFCSSHNRKGLLPPEISAPLIRRKGGN